MPSSVKKGFSALPAWLRLMRPEQWTKNALVMVAFFFAYWDPSQHLRGTGWRPLLQSVSVIGAQGLSLFMLCFSAAMAETVEALMKEDRRALHPAGLAAGVQALRLDRRGGDTAFDLWDPAEEKREKG